MTYKAKTPTKRQRLKYLDQARNYAFEAMWKCHDAGESELSGYLSKLADMILEARNKASTVGPIQPRNDSER